VSLLGGRHDDRAQLFDELATMLDAGLPVSKAVEHAAERRGGPYRALADVVADGRPLSEAMAAQGAMFTAFERRLVTAGERSGDLPRVLARLGAHHAGRGKLRAGLLGGIAYPVILLHLAVLLPNFKVLFFDGLFAYAGVVVPPIAIGWGLVALVVFGLRGLGVGQATRVAFHRAILAVPVLGSLNQKLALADLADALGLLYGAGVPVREAMAGAADACSNAAIGDAVARAGRGIDEGLDLAGSLRLAQPLVPRLFIDLVETGEKTGKVDEMLAKAESVYREQAERASGLIVKLVPVAVFLLVAAYIGYIVISSYVQLYSGLL